MPERRIPTRLNMALVVLFLAANVFQFLVLPAFLLPRSAWWLLALLPLAFLSNPMWFLTHEAFHRNLHPDGKTNDRLGKVLAVFFGAPYEVVRFGHLMHHRFNGSLFDRPDLYDPATTSRPRAWASYLFSTFGGLYLQELLCFYPFFLGKKTLAGLLKMLFDREDPVEGKLVEQAERVFLDDATIASVRLQAAAFTVLMLVSLILYGGWWFLVPLMLAARGVLVSFFNNLPHYAAAQAADGKSLNLSMPRLAHLFYLDFYHHRVHHAAPTLPWTQLREGFAERGETYDMPFVRAALAQFEGPQQTRRTAATAEQG